MCWIWMTRRFMFLLQWRRRDPLTRRIRTETWGGDRSTWRENIGGHAHHGLGFVCRVRSKETKDQMVFCSQNDVFLFCTWDAVSLVVDNVVRVLSHDVSIRQSSPLEKKKKSNNEDEIQRFHSCLLWLLLHVSFFVLPLVIDDQYHDYATVTTSSLVPIVVVAWKWSKAWPWLVNTLWFIHSSSSSTHLHCIEERKNNDCFLLPSAKYTTYQEEQRRNEFLSAHRHFRAFAFLLSDDKRLYMCVKERQKECQARVDASEKRTTDLAGSSWEQLVCNMYLSNDDDEGRHQRVELFVDDLTKQRTIFVLFFAAALEIVGGVILQLLLSSVWLI